MTLTEYEEYHSQYLNQYFRNLLWDTEDHYSFHIAMLTEYLSSNPENPFALNTRGLAYKETGNGNSISDFYSSIRISEHATPYKNLGDLFSNNDRPNDAIDCYSKAIALVSDDPTTYRLRAKPLVLVGKIEQAIEDYTKAIELQPGISHDHKARAELYLTIGNLSLAEVDQKIEKELRIDERPEIQEKPGGDEIPEERSSHLKDIVRLFWKK